MAKKIFEWFYYLVENLLTAVTTDYTAKVKSKKSRTVEDIANHIVSQRTEYRKETIVSILNMSADATVYFLSQGDRVNLGTVILEPSIVGAFDGTTDFNPELHKCVVNAHVTNTVHKMLAEVGGSYSGLTVDNGGAAIDRVTDSTTGKTDGIVTAGKVVTVSGKKIKIVPEEGETIENCITFTNAATEQVITQADALVINDPSKLVFQLPTLAAGNYTLTIKTLFANASINLKAAREITFKTKLIVE